MKRIRLICFVLSFFSVISLACIGFSSWIITANGIFSQTGEITASPVIQFDEYITFNSEKDSENGSTNGIKCFEFYSDGFVIDQIHSNTATITVYYVLNQAKCFETFGSSVQLEFYLRATDCFGSALDFSLIGFDSVEVPTINGLNLSLSTDVSSTDTNLKHACIISGLVESGANIEFSVTYNFDITELDFANAYSLLYDEESETFATFIAHARVSTALIEE